MNLIKWKGLDIDPTQISESTIVQPKIQTIETIFNESTDSTETSVLYPTIEAIHAVRTKNHNRYLAEKLKGDPNLKTGVYSWTDPYPKPVIYNHNPETDATGRVFSASYSEFTAAGHPGIIVTPKITDKKAIDGILGKRLLTVSIGASTNEATCSICGTDIINEGFCGHMRGEVYDGKTTEWVLGDLWFNELSWVNIPSDKQAQIIDVSHGGSQMVARSEQIEIQTEQLKVENKKEDTFVKKEKQDQSKEGKEETKSTETKENEENFNLKDMVDAFMTGKVVEKLIQEKESLESTKEELENSNASLVEELKTSLTNISVLIEGALGKELTEEEQSAKTEKTNKELFEYVSDLIKDFSLEKYVNVRTVEKVEKPQGASVTESTEVTTVKEEVISNNEEAIYALLTGKTK